MIDVEHEGGVATVRLGNERRANALETSDWQALAALFEGLENDCSLRVVIVTGRGGMTFSAGSDMREWIGASPAQIDNSFLAMEMALSAIERLSIPVIAKVRGAALGAGCQLACACDLRIVASEAKLGMPIARWGILLPAAFAARIARQSGPATARDLLLTGRLVEGDEAVRLGLASASVAEADLDSATTDMAAAITALPQTAIRAAKQSLNSVLTPTEGCLRTPEVRPAADYTLMQRELRGFFSNMVVHPNPS